MCFIDRSRGGVRGPDPLPPPGKSQVAIVFLETLVRTPLEKQFEKELDTLGPVASGLQIYGGPGSLSHIFKILPITFQVKGPVDPFFLVVKKFHFNKDIHVTASL